VNGAPTIKKTSPHLRAATCADSERRTYIMAAGRIFLAPASLEDELWFNIGTTLQSGQAYAEWTELLAPVISRGAYDEMVGRVQEICRRRALNPLCLGLSLGLMPLCGAGLLGCLYMRVQLNSMIAEITQAVEPYGGRAHLAEVASTNVSPAMYSFDQNGQQLMDRAGRRAPSPSWPPMGLHVIIKPRAGVNPRAFWPGGMTAVPVVATTVQAQVMSRDGAGTSLTDRLAQLADLKRTGALDETQYGNAVAAEIAKG